MKQGDGERGAEPAAAATVFGNQLGQARAYERVLATAGVERGLIGPREVPRLWERHLLNCAVAAELIPAGARVVDIGSGAGLPGIPLALARPDLQITLVEPLLRRTSFLEEFLAEATLAVTVLRGRAEQPEILRQAGGADVVTSRAVAPLGKLARWSLPLLGSGGVMLALKGASAADEVARDDNDLKAAGASRAEVVECGGSVLDTPTTVVRVWPDPSKRPNVRKTGKHARHGERHC